MFPKNINILGHCVYPKTENNYFDLIVTFPNDQSEADKIHKNYKKYFRSSVSLPVLPCTRSFAFMLPF